MEKVRSHQASVDLEQRRERLSGVLESQKRRHARIGSGKYKEGDSWEYDVKIGQTRAFARSSIAHVEEKIASVDEAMSEIASNSQSLLTEARTYMEELGRFEAHLADLTVRFERGVVKPSLYAHHQEQYAALKSRADTDDSLQLGILLLQKERDDEDRNKKKPTPEETPPVLSQTIAPESPMRSEQERTYEVKLPNGERISLRDQSQALALRAIIPTYFEGNTLSRATWARKTFTDYEGMRSIAQLAVVRMGIEEVLEENGFQIVKEKEKSGSKTTGFRLRSSPRETEKTIGQYTTHAKSSVNEVLLPTEKNEEEKIRENVALLSSLMQSRVGTNIYLDGTTKFPFTLTEEIAELFLQLPEGVRIRNGNGDSHHPPSSEEIKKRRHEAVLWLQPIYEQYKNTEYFHPDEHVDLLITALYELDESVMGNHLIQFLLDEPQSRILMNNRQYVKGESYWKAPIEMVKAVREKTKQQQEVLVQETHTPEETIVFSEVVLPETVSPAEVIGSIMEDPGIIATHFGEVYAIPQRVKENPIVERDPEIEEKLRTDLQKVVQQVRIVPATSLQISRALGMPENRVRKIIDYFKLKVISRKRNIPQYDRVGMMIIEYAREFDWKVTPSFKSDETEALKHMAIGIHAEWEKEKEEERARRLDGVSETGNGRNTNGKNEKH